MYFVNPEITWKSDSKSTYEEGCLSIPNQFAKIDRPEKCNVKFWYDENYKEIKAEGLLKPFQRNDIKWSLFLIFVKLKKDIIIKKVSKDKKETERVVV